MSPQREPGISGSPAAVTLAALVGCVLAIPLLAPAAYVLPGALLQLAAWVQRQLLAGGILAAVFVGCGCLAVGLRRPRTHRPWPAR